MIDLGPRARVAFAALFLGGQLALVATAGARADRSYGFRMFASSATVQLEVSRRLDDGGLLPIEGGEWTARDCAGAPHHFVWLEMVRFPAPMVLDSVELAPYGGEAGLAEARGAVAWVAHHTDGDCQTLALVARATVRENGRTAEPVVFTVERAAP